MICASYCSKLDAHSIQSLTKIPDWLFDYQLQVISLEVRWETGYVYLAGCSSATEYGEVLMEIQLQLFQ